MACTQSLRDIAVSLLFVPVFQGLNQDLIGVVQLARERLEVLNGLKHSLFQARQSDSVHHVFLPCLHLLGACSQGNFQYRAAIHL